MKNKLLIIITTLSLFSFSAFATSVKCEMVDVKDATNKIVALAEIDTDDYAFDESDDPIDNLYWFSFEVEPSDIEGELYLSLILNDDNDEVGSFGCDIKKSSVGAVCSEPIYDRDNKLRYNITCSLIK